MSNRSNGNFFLVPKEISFVQCSSSSPSAPTVENTQTSELDVWEARACGYKQKAPAVAVDHMVADLQRKSTSGS